MSVQTSVDVSAASRIVLFDKVWLKGGRELPVKVTVLEPLGRKRSRRTTRSSLIKTARKCAVPSKAR